ncbi:MAG: serine hydrolase [Saprospiraceae bacterium]
MKFILIFIILLPITITAQKNVLQDLLKKHPELDSIITQSAKYQVQIIYTQIDRDAQNRPNFKTYTVGLDTNQYFYPASMVKMPAAFMALEKLNELKIIGLDKNSPMITGAGRYPQSPMAEDSSAENLMPSIAHYIKKIFLVSDNDAHNRLYEFLGQSYFNQALYDKGYRSTRLIHRLAVSGFDKEANRYTNPVSFNNAEKLLYHQGEVYSIWDSNVKLKGQQKGKGYINSQDSLVNVPFDFSGRNFISLLDLHRMLTAVMLPEGVAAKERFNLTDEDYRFLYTYMSMRPRESRYPSYNEKDYWDSYVKFFLFGDNKNRIPDNIRIFNKVGEAYGTLTDVAYIVDFEHKIEFLLSATILVNADGIFNDGVYEYDTIGFPFLAKLGQAVYDFEKKRPKKQLPDLSKYNLDYKN